MTATVAYAEHVADIVRQAERLDPLVQVTVLDPARQSDWCQGCPCTACDTEGCIGVCEVVWTTAIMPNFAVDDVGLDCLVHYLDDVVLRERAQWVEVTVRRPAPWVVTA